MNVAQLADQLRRDHQFMQDVTRWEVIPARPAKTAPFPEGLDPRLMPLISGVLREFQAPSRTGELVAALRPWLDEERGRRLEKALRIARLTRAAKAAIPELGMRR